MITMQVTLAVVVEGLKMSTQKGRNCVVEKKKEGWDSLNKTPFELGSLTRDRCEKMMMMVMMMAVTMMVVVMMVLVLSPCTRGLPMNHLVCSGRGGL